MREFEPRSPEQFFAEVVTLVQKVRWTGDFRLRVFIGKERKRQGEDDLVFTRKGGKRRLDVALIFNDERLMVGNIRLSDGPRAYRGGLAFDAQGRISNVAKGIRSEVGGAKEIDVLAFLYAAMDPEDLGQPIDLGRLLSEASW